ncbi:MAG: c-type cytochrome [Actinobacteria bacterium]|nr:c-type cytochrome [Actinomycetota bacterium]
MIRRFHSLAAGAALAAGALALLLVGGGGVAAQDVERDGRTLFLQHCAACHGAEGRGTFRGPELAGSGAAGAHFQVSTGRMPPPASQRRPERVPPVEFTDPEVLALARYVGRIAGGPEIPRVDLARADLSRGADLYLQACAACHGSTGGGGVLTNGDVAPALTDLSPVQIAEAMITGPGEMPKFGAEAFDARERDAIVRYVEEVVERPRNRGGVAVGYGGTGIDAVVALLVALPLLLLVAARLGRRSEDRIVPQNRREHG